MRLLSTHWIYCCLVAALFCPENLVAQKNDTPFSESRDQSEGKDKQYYQLATEYFKQREYRKASKYFRMVYEMTKMPAMLFNIGQVELADDRYGLALEAFQKYLDEGGDTISAASKEEVLNTIDAIQGMVGYLFVRCLSGCTVRVDGIERGVTPFSRPIALKKETLAAVEIRYREEKIYTKQVLVKEGQSTEIDATDAAKGALELMERERSAQAKRSGPLAKKTAAVPVQPSQDEQAKRKEIRHHFRRWYVGRDLTVAFASLSGVFFLTGGLSYLAEDFRFQPLFLGFGGLFLTTSTITFISYRYHKRRALKLNQSATPSDLDNMYIYGEASHVFRSFGLTLNAVASVSVVVGIALAIVGFTAKGDDTGPVMARTGMAIMVGGLGVTAISIIPLVLMIKYERGMERFKHRVENRRDVSWSPIVVPFRNGALLGIGGTF